jgi:hypothetical protein
MRLHDGYQTCPRCSGAGCYRCHKTGHLVQCPICGASELEYTKKQDDDTYRCLCGAQFDRGGQVILAPEVEKKANAKKPPHKLKGS